MTTPAAPTKTKQADVPPDQGEALRRTWETYGNMIYLVCGVILLAILAKGGWDYLNRQKELGIQNEFALCVTPDSFRSFASNHPGHPLAGAAEVMVADNSYASGKYGDAVSAYSAAIPDLPQGPVLARARLGLAMSMALSGRVSDAEASLRQIINDATLSASVRCEAGYHLAVMSVAAGRGADVQKLAEQVMQIDPESPFAERTFALRSSTPEAPAAAPAVGLPAVALPGKP
ncbi:MAG: tetratricopeptide repeat protein [Opitutaceae bacterium]